MNEDESKEYFVLNEMVTSFDQRLLTVKGWGVTLSLVALGLGFQYKSFGMFLVSAVSSVVVPEKKIKSINMPCSSNTTSCKIARNRL